MQCVTPSIRLCRIRHWYCNGGAASQYCNSKGLVNQSLRDLTKTTDVATTLTHHRYARQGVFGFLGVFTSLKAAASVSRNTGVGTSGSGRDLLRSTTLCLRQVLTKRWVPAGLVCNIVSNRVWGCPAENSDRRCLRALRVHHDYPKEGTLKAAPAKSCATPKHSSTHVREIENEGQKSQPTSKE